MGEGALAVSGGGDPMPSTPSESESTNTSGNTTPITVDDAGGSTPTIDAGAGPAHPCNVDKPFGTPTAVTELHSEYYDVFPRLSPDELTIVFARESAYGQLPNRQILIARRASRALPFDAPLSVLNVNSNHAETDPAIGHDGLSLWFVRDTGNQDIFLATRPSVTSDFGAPTAVMELNTSPTHDRSPIVVRNGEEIWFTSERPNGLGGADIYRALRVGSGYGTPQAVMELNSPAHESALAVSADALTVYFSSMRPGGQGEDIWFSRRASLANSFSAPVNVSELNTAGMDGPGWVSEDGCRLYFHSSTPTKSDYDIYVATKPKL